MIIDSVGGPIPPDDRGLLLGDGLFETVLAVNGALVLMDAHAARIRAGAAVLGLPAPEPVRLEAAARAALAAAGLQAGRAAVRLTWTAGSGGRGLDRPAEVSPRLLASAAASPPAPTALRLVTARVRRNQGSPASRLKSLSYLDNALARREARTSGADEAVMLNGRGEVACAAAGNLFWRAEGRWFTPALTCGVLAGVMRGELMRRMALLGTPVEEQAAGPQALTGAEAVVVTNSLVGVRPVVRLDGRSWDDLSPAQALAAAVADIS